MKLLTLNTHSLIERNYETKLRIFCDCISRIKPDIIAMQEVNQEPDKPIAAMCGGFAVREDNHALRVCEMLREKGMEYRYFWHGTSTKFGKYCEGVAVLSRLPVEETDVFQTDSVGDRRGCDANVGLGIKVCNSWFYTVHMGDARFSKQLHAITERSKGRGQVWLMGDFHCPRKSEEYNEIIKSGWSDTFTLADNHPITDTENTADYVFVNSTPRVRSTQVIFNGIREPMVSDHNGVLVTL